MPDKQEQEQEPPTHQEIALLAEQYYREGCEDTMGNWLRAEKALSAPPPRVFSRDVVPVPRSEPTPTAVHKETTFGVDWTVTAQTSR